MGLAIVELDARPLAGLGQHVVAKGESGQCCGVEIGKGVEGIALDVAAQGRRVQEAGVEMCVVTHQYGPVAPRITHLPANS